ncbi:MAG: DinB family protein [Chitinophagaceae bacterium]
MITQHDVIASESFRRYISLAEHDPLEQAISQTGEAFLSLLRKIQLKQTDYAYAEGKWTIKELLQHVIDAERVFAFRALWFARNDGKALPGFDENVWAANASVSTRDWNDMVAEFESVRKTTELLFASFDENQLKACGTASNNNISVVAIGYVCAGHVTHHMNILKERYHVI